MSRFPSAGSSSGSCPFPLAGLSLAAAIEAIYITTTSPVALLVSYLVLMLYLHNCLFCRDWAVSLYPSLLSNVSDV